MSDHPPKPDATIEEMWRVWLPTATKGARLSRAETGRVRMAYYAGAHNMLGKVLAILRSPADADHIQRRFKEASAELDRFIDTYQGE